MYGLIVSREHSKDAHDAIKGGEIWFEKVGSFSAEIFLQHCQAAAAVNLSILIVDLDTTDPASFIRGIRIFRQSRRDTRIILLAPGRKPGDPTITSLLPLQIYDIVAPEGDLEEENDEEEEDHEEGDYEGNYVEEDPDALSYLAILIKNQIAGDYGYGNIARWDTLADGIIEINVQHQTVQEKVREKDKDKKKNRDRPFGTDPALVEHIHSIEIEPPPDRLKVKEVVVREHIAGTVIIAIAGSGNRTGTTHSAIQISNILQKLNVSVACVELLDPTTGKPVFEKFKSGDQLASVEGGFRYKEVDYYPEANMKQYLKVLSVKYDYIVLDLGDCLNNQYYEEFFRAQVSILTCGSSVWDFDELLNTLDHLYQRSWNKHMCIFINLGDDETFEMTAKTFSKKEKKHMNVDFYQGPFQPDPFLVDDDNRIPYEAMLGGILPTETKKKKKFGGLFRR